MKEKFFSKVDFVFLFFVTLAFSLRTIYFTQTIQFIQPGLGSDGSFYLQWAEDIVRGEIIGRNTFFALPIYPYFLSLAYLFSGGEIFSLILIQIFLGSLNCGLIYILGKKLFNLQVGIMAGIFASFYMMFIFYDRMLGPTSLAIFLGLVLMLVMLRLKENPSVKAWWTVGFSLGLCALTAASFLLLFVLIIFWLFYEFKKEPRQTVILSGLAFIVAFSLMLVGITLRNYLVAQDPALITAHSGINFYLGNNTQANGLFKVPPYMRATQSGLIEDAQIIAETISARRLKPSEASNFWFKQSLNFIHTEPLTYLKLLGKKFLLFYNGREYIDDIEYYLYNEKISSFRKIPLFGFSLILPLAVLGIFCSWPKEKRDNSSLSFCGRSFVSDYFFFY